MFDSPLASLYRSSVAIAVPRRWEWKGVPYLSPRSGRRAAKIGIHPDELRPVESHLQTEHKLEVMRRYFGQYAAIIANAARAGRLKARHIFLIDAFAGSGLHASADHPDGAVPGTALLAVLHARNVQRMFPEIRVHVRLVDAEPTYCVALNRRCERFRSAPPGVDHVDVSVIPRTSEEAVPVIMAEITEFPDAFALWFFDPFGVKTLPLAALAPILGRPRGHEIVINLDVGGLFRVRAVAEKKSIEWEQLSEANARVLDLVYGGDSWRVAYGGVKIEDPVKRLDMLVEAYQRVFQLYQFTKHHRLRSSDTQVRYLVHFSQARRAIDALTSSYNASCRTGILKGRQLSGNEKARFAQELFKHVAGETTSVDELYENQILALDKNQLRALLRDADALGYGRFEERTAAFTWALERTAPLSLARPLSRDDGPQLNFQL